MRAHGVVSNKQEREWIGYAVTTGATITQASAAGVSAAAANNYNLPSGLAAMLRVQVIARQSAGAGAGDCAGWTTDVLLKNISGTTSIVGTPSVTKAYGDTGAAAWAIAITPDNTSDTLKIEVTGEASKTIEWTVLVQGPEA